MGSSLPVPGAARIGHTLKCDFEKILSLRGRVSLASVQEQVSRQSSQLVWPEGGHGWGWVNSYPSSHKMKERKSLQAHGFANNPMLGEKHSTQAKVSGRKSPWI